MERIKVYCGKCISFMDGNRCREAKYQVENVVELKYEYNYCYIENINRDCKNFIEKQSMSKRVLIWMGF